MSRVARVNQKPASASNKLKLIGDPCLRIKSKPIPIEQIGAPETKIEIGKLRAAEKSLDAVGLAAPQIGIHKRFFLAGIKKDSVAGYDIKLLPPLTVINPILSFPNPQEKIVVYESCLSVPSFVGKVMRHKYAHVMFYDELGKRFRIEAEGFIAALFQHENDHLDGVLFVDRLESTHDLYYKTQFFEFYHKEWNPTGTYELFPID